MTRHLRLLLLAAILPAFSVRAADPSASELRDELAALQAQVKALQARLDQMQASSAAQAQAPSPAPSAAADAEAASAPKSDTVISGYGEIAYNAYLRDSGRNEADLRRFVLALSHTFNDHLVFNGEIEWEHAVASAEDRGETEIEQAYLSYAATPSLNVKAGLFLMPFGFLNTSHEPPSYFGVERNEVETRIIPSTWREGGIAVYGATDAGFAWELGATTGFDAAGFDEPAKPLAAMHQELQHAKAHDIAGYAALNYRGVPGLTVGGAVFRGDAGQGNADHRSDPSLPDLAGIKAPVTLWETHVRWQSGGLDLQALAARGTLGDAGRIDAILGDFAAAGGGARPALPSAFSGWLVQAAYTVWHSGDMSLTPFARLEAFDTQARMPAGFPADPANRDAVATFGLSFKPHPQVVMKADYQKFRDHPADDRCNLGLGYMF